MLKNRTAILQIVPRTPGSQDGVGDYALKLSERLQADYGIETMFAAAPLESIKSKQCASCRGIIFHYVNYGYQPRGVPLQLPAILRQLRQTCGGRLLTIFHELYASAPPWRSAFWLQPLQKSIARTIAQLSDTCAVSSETMRDMLLQLEPGSKPVVHPVVSTLGEPTFSSDQFVRRDPHRWVIFGGTHLLQRSLRSLRRRIASIPDAFSPRELFVIGGVENKGTRDELEKMAHVSWKYHPAMEAGAASAVLSSCAFGWIDYFRQRNVPTAAVLKSGSFASYCAHGVIPVFAGRASAIALQDDPMPGPCFVATDGSNLPPTADRVKISAEIYEWYHRHCAIEHLAKAIVELLQLNT